MTWMRRNSKGQSAWGSDTAPLARMDELVVEDLPGEAGAVDEVLIYDQRTDQAHCLSRDAAMVWRVCDGRTQPAELAKALNLDIDVVTRALEELTMCDLLDASPIGGVTRREATLRMVKVGGAVTAAPLIYSILAPTPALAQSQIYCLNVISCIGGVNLNGEGCATCFKAGCVCCGAGSSGEGKGVKLCTADCTCTYCTPEVIHVHCQSVCNNQSTCTSGPSGLPKDQNCGPQANC